MASLARQVRDVRDLDGLRAAMASIGAAYRDDPEAAHSAEDDLLRRVLRLAAEGHPQAREMAAAVLTTTDWDVPRWCA